MKISMLFRPKKHRGAPADAPAAKKRSRWRSRILILALVALAPALLWGLRHYHLKRLADVAPGKLIRVAQPTQDGLYYLIEVRGAKTVISVRRKDAPLDAGLLDWGEDDGPLESEYVASLGARFVHWPMGGEAYWPWIGPTQFEEFFELFDDPANLPAVVHCIGGRHRTGTISALYRMEYDRWNAARAIAEMQSFDFGPTVPVHDHNLRTYLPRPLPDPHEWQALEESLPAAAGGAGNYAQLVRRLRKGAAQQDVLEYVRRRRPFSLCLAARLIESAGDALAEPALQQAEACLEDADASPRDWAAAAALVADYGGDVQQQALLQLLIDEPKRGEPSPRYRAIVRGVTNRYTPNRIAYLAPLLDDLRRRPEPEASAYRYCDTASARMVSILNEGWVVYPTPEDWATGLEEARRWFQEHTDARKPRRLEPWMRRQTVANGGEPYEDRDGYR